MSTTTDRVSNLDSLRTITDRLGQTVVIGDAKIFGAFSMGAVSKMVIEPGGALSVITTALLTLYNKSTGPWLVYWNPQVVAQASWAGAVKITGDVDEQAVVDQDMWGS